MMAVETSGSWRFTGRMALGLFVGFFAIVFAVNGVMLTMALKTHSGVVANEPYRKGLKYNDRIAADAMQAELGWASDIAVSPDARRLVVRLNDKAGAAVDGMKVLAEIGRPSSNHQDLRFELAPTAPGRYEVALPELETGAYIATLDVATARGGEADVVYRARRRLWIKR
ncbi:MAG: FixH family protein [Hyphomicrobium sp.]